MTTPNTGAEQVNQAGTPATPNTQQTPPAEQPKESEGATPAEEKDWKAEAEKAQQTIRQLEGRLKRQPEGSGEIDGIRTELRRLRQQVELQALEPEERAQRQAELTQQEQELLTQQRNQRDAARIRSAITSKLEAVGLELADKRLGSALNLWQRGAPNGQIQDMDALWDALQEVEDVVEQEHEAKTKKELDEAKKRLLAEQQERNIENDELDVGPVRGTGAAGKSPPTLEQLSKVDTRYMTPSQLREHEQAVDAAMRANR